MTGAPSSTHWGPVRARLRAGQLVVEPHEIDPDPSPLVRNMGPANDHGARVRHPVVRRGWLESGPGPSDARGRDEFVRVGWPELVDRLVDELRRVIDRHGNEAIFGGSYGWGSAGRFHHPQSQVHRFLAAIGGYTRSVNTYSTGASSVILPHVLGPDVDAVHGLTAWDVLADHTELVVAFGGMPTKNMQVAPGGVARHRSADELHRMLARGTEIVVVSPRRTDCPDGDGVRWCPIRPGTDVALILAILWVLVARGLHDTVFLRTRCTGWEQLEAYVRGTADGVAKTPEWAALRTGVPAAEITALALRMAARRTFVAMTWSLQRAAHGEQPPWAGIALAAALGQIGQRGGGFGHGYGSMADVGIPQLGRPLPTLPQGRNPVRSFIPVARIADMLLHPGSEFDYDGNTYRYPSARLVYWCGGNPFHHHQDLTRLRRALGRPDTVVVHETFWTATARHADIVVPSASALERADLGASRNDPVLMAMHRAADPPGEARTDYETFAELAAALGVQQVFSEGRSAQDWLRHLYEGWRGGRADLPGFDAFWAAGSVELPAGEPGAVMLADFARDPAAHPLGTPSGRIELTSATVAAFGYDDCPGHPTWFPPPATTAQFPLVLVTSQPARRLHSQHDMGPASQETKVAGREPLVMHPVDAERRGIADGDVVLVTSAQGACLAGAVLTDDIASGCVQLATGAWYDPWTPDGSDRTVCRHGNVNVLTTDQGTSRLAQGCSGQIVVVDVAPLPIEAPPVGAFAPPTTTPSTHARTDH